MVIFLLKNGDFDPPLQPTELPGQPRHKPRQLMMLGKFCGREGLVLGGFFFTLKKITHHVGVSQKYGYPEMDGL